VEGDKDIQAIDEYVYWFVEGIEVEGGGEIIFGVLNDASPYGIGIDIYSDLLEIFFIFNDGGLISIPPEVTGAVVAFVVFPGYHTVDELHCPVDVGMWGSEYNVVMIAHEDKMGYFH